MSSSTHISLARNQPNPRSGEFTAEIIIKRLFARLFQLFRTNDEPPPRLGGASALSTRSRNSRFDAGRRRTSIGGPIPRDSLRQGPSEVRRSPGGRRPGFRAGLLKVWVRTTSTPSSTGSRSRSVLELSFSFPSILFLETLLIGKWQPSMPASSGRRGASSPFTPRSRASERARR